MKNRFSRKNVRLLVLAYLFAWCLPHQGFVERVSTDDFVQLMSVRVNCWGGGERFEGAPLVLFSNCCFTLSGHVGDLGFMC